MSFPPHTSLQVQPLDSPVYGPTKKFANSASEAWICTKPGQTMIIYDTPLPNALTPENNSFTDRIIDVYLRYIY